MRFLEEEARRQRQTLERHWTEIERRATPEAKGEYIAGLPPVEQARLPQHELGRVKARVQQIRSAALRDG